MKVESKENYQNETHTKKQASRRGFMKKAVYAAPTLIVMGQLIKPKAAKADFGGPPSDPEGNGW